MTVSEKQRAYNKAYDAANMAYQTFKINRKTLDQFKTLCREHGDKVNAVLCQAVKDYIADHASRE